MNHKNSSFEFLFLYDLVDKSYQQNLPIFLPFHLHYTKRISHNSSKIDRAIHRMDLSSILDSYSIFAVNDVLIRYGADIILGS